MLKFAKTPSVGLLLLFALAGAAMAEDEFVSWGDVYFHNGTTGKYAVYHDKSSPNYEYYKGPWMRVWYQGNYVLTAGFSSYENGWATLGWYNYFTNGTQWTGTYRGGVDGQNHWSLRNVGKFAFNVPTPGLLKALLETGGVGFCRVTYKPSGPQTQQQYRPVRDTWKQMTLVPVEYDSAAVDRLVRAVTGSQVRTQAPTQASTTFQPRQGVNLLDVQSSGVSW